MSTALAARTAIRSLRAAAVAGIVFSVLLAFALAQVRSSTPSDPTTAGDWLVDGSRCLSVVAALNLLPFAAIAFLWSIGVVFVFSVRILILTMHTRAGSPISS